MSIAIYQDSNNCIAYYTECSTTTKRLGTHSYRRNHFLREENAMSYTMMSP